MGKEKILLVEDESIEDIDIKRTLESFGYTVPYHFPWRRSSR